MSAEFFNVTWVPHGRKEVLLLTWNNAFFKSGTAAYMLDSTKSTELSKWSAPLSQLRLGNPAQVVLNVAISGPSCSHSKAWVALHHSADILQWDARSPLPILDAPPPPSESAEPETRKSFRKGPFYLTFQR